MAWPLSRLTTYIANSLPVIKSIDLNAIQDWVTSLSLGTVSLKALKVDAAGGQAVAPAAGTVEAQTVVVNSSAGGGLMAEGTLFKNLLPFARCFGAQGGGVVGGAGAQINLLSYTHNNTGDYTLLTSSCPAAYAGLADNTPVYVWCGIVPMILGGGAWGVPQYTVTKQTSGGQPVLQVHILVYNQAGPVDMPLGIQLWP